MHSQSLNPILFKPEYQIFSQPANRSLSEHFLIKNIDNDSYQVYEIEETDSVDEDKEKSFAKRRVSLWNHYWDQIAKTDAKLLKLVLDKDLKNLQRLLTQQPIQLNSFIYIDGWTLLHHAVLYSSQSIVRLLIQHKINLSAISTQMKRTAFHKAVLSNKINNVKILLQNMSDLNIQDIDGNTGAHYAANFSYCDIFELLIASQLQLNFKLKNNQQMTIIDCVRDKKIFKLIELKYPHEVNQNQNQKSVNGNRRVFKLEDGSVIGRPSKNDLIERFLYLNQPNLNQEKGSILDLKLQKTELTSSLTSSDSSLNNKKRGLGCRPSNWILKKGQIIASQSICLMKNSILDSEDKQISPNQSLASYDILRYIGSGGFADVFLARKKKSSQLFAIKRISKGKILQNNLKRYVYSQRNIMIKSAHPFIVAAEAMFQDQSYLYISMEYCQCGDLLRVLSLRGKIPQNQVKIYAAQSGLALEYLHSKNILFRDLKAANVLVIKDGYIKVSDFGLAKESMISFTFLGSVQYLAPEMVVESEIKQHTKSIDWYLFGVLIYELLTGKPPFQGQKQETIFKKIRQEKPFYPSYLSKQCKILLSKLLQKDPSKRLGSVKDFEQIKAEEWFSNVDFQKILRKQYKVGFVEPTIKESDIRKKTLADNFLSSEKQQQYFKEWNYTKKDSNF